MSLLHTTYSRYMMCMLLFYLLFTSTIYRSTWSTVGDHHTLILGDCQTCIRECIKCGWGPIYAGYSGCGGEVSQIEQDTARSGQRVVISGQQVDGSNG